jgi:hypothetical protein
MGRQEEEREIRWHRGRVFSKRRPLPLIIMIMQKMITIMKYKFNKIVICVPANLTAQRKITKRKQIKI